MRRTVLAALLLCVTACGGEDGSTGPEPGELPYVPQLVDQEPVAKDTEVGDCALEPGVQAVDGSLTNTASQPKDFVVTLSWVDDELELRGQGVAVVEDVAPGETARWSITANPLEGATQCIPAVFRGELPADAEP